MKKTKLYLTYLLITFSAYLLAQPTIGFTSFSLTASGTTSIISAVSSCTTTKSANIVDGWLVSISTMSTCGFNINSTAPSDGHLNYLIGGFANLNYLTFGSSNGGEFSLVGITISSSTSSCTSVSMLYQGYKNGLAISGATLQANTPSATFPSTVSINFTSNPLFQDVDDIRVTTSGYCGGTFQIWGITTSNAIPSCPTPTLNIIGQTNVLCNGGSNGSATMLATGGVPFTYTWSPSGGNAATAVGLGAGIYTCATTNSCGVTASQTVNISEPLSALASSTAATSPLCNGNNGSATVTASGGTAPYTYTWSSGPTSSVEPTLLAGTYTVKVIDNNGCSITKSVTITQPSALSATGSQTNVLCFGQSTGSAKITASGGTGAYSYLWSTTATTSVITGQPSGVKTCTITDANNCKRTNTITITQPALAISTATGVTNVLCFGNATGSATITASGGTSPYSYSWSGAQTTSVTSGQTSGVRTVTVTDANSCNATNTVTITQPASSLATSTTVTNVLCFGNSTGAATVTASGGTSPYSYLWSGAQTTSVTSGQTSGVRTVTVTDANSCIATNTATITQPASGITTFTAVTNVLCFGNSTGASTVTASGGISPYSYLWSTGATTSVITSQTAGLKTVTVTDVNGCNKTSTVSINQPLSGITTTTAVTNIICFNDGTATLTVAGGIAPYAYLWSSAQTTSVITSLNTGVITVTVTDAGGCSRSNTVTITQSAGAITTATAVTNVLCNGASNASATIIASGGTAPYTYLWSSGATTSVIASQTAGVKTVTVTDSNGCPVTNTVTITQPTAINLIAYGTSNICQGTNAFLGANATGGTGSISYSWNPGALAGASQTVAPSSNQVYTVIATDVNNCTTNTTQTVSVNTVPVISVNSGSICIGQSYTMTANGAITYTYSSGSNVVSPTTSSDYTVSGTDSNGCNNTTVSSVTVNALPIISATTSNILLCTGQTASLTAIGATSYTWNTNATTPVITVSPTITTNFTVNGVDVNGCSNVATVTQNVSTCTDIQSTLNSQQSVIQIYPNPTSGMLNVELEMINEGNATIEITNTLGQTLFTEKLTVQHSIFNISNFKEGVYLIKVISGNTQMTNRLVIHK